MDYTTCVCVGKKDSTFSRMFGDMRSHRQRSWYKKLDDEIQENWSKKKEGKIKKTFQKKYKTQNE